MWRNRVGVYLEVHLPCFCVAHPDYLLVRSTFVVVVF